MDSLSDVNESFSALGAIDDLHSFLVDQQGHTEEEAREIIERIISPNGLSLEHFQNYLFDVELNPPIRPSEVRDDMHAPLSHYYVFTGHNSYLTGNQLTSNSGVDPIIKALQRGVRVIELDIWANSSDDDIDVYHGSTITSHVKLKDCLEAIKEHAFSVSPYPVVLNLENHLTPDLQAKTAQMIEETFGESLFYPNCNSMDEFPSPQSLMNRIIVSAEHREEGTEEESGKYNQVITIKDGKPKDGLLKEALIDKNPDICDEGVGQLNISESLLEEASELYAPDMVRFSQKNIIRVYPKGLRIGSSNYDPFPGWVNGAQMVAFNMQGDSKFLWLMHGFFLANGGSGYVKKPDYLVSDPLYHLQENIIRPIKMTLKVKIYLGDGWKDDFKKNHFDSFSPPDFYIEVGIAGAPSDEIIFNTKHVRNSWNPIWDEEFSFPLIVPELAILSFIVLDSGVGRDDFGGQICFPVLELKPGIRAVQLSDRQGNKYKSVKILTKFEFS
ncbi:Phosphoinositide phospholipase C [Zostera marina]|uniref:Phosphoinositide phospholipase C n=1 Tax=Zostera marina TaxID=29655 RepID=A0A0K9PCI3_ZOSMR|nr:Phosphoinositide phospholipase C [Zostera marina]